MGSTSWTDAVQAIGAIGSLLVAVVGFLFVVRQIRQVERSIRGDVSERLYTQNMELLRLLADNPQLVPYFYDNVEIGKGNPNYNQALIVAEVTASFFELVSLQMGEISESAKPGWIASIRDSYASSPLLREYLEEYADWYAPELHKICGSNVGGKPPVAQPPPKAAGD